MTPTTGRDPDIEPDTKDWTWVLDRPCPECGYDALSVRRIELAEQLRANAAAWEPVLGSDGARLRPSPEVWSPLEYACHVRDVHTVFAGRVRAMLDDDDPLFENWDQDEAAAKGGYSQQDPVTVAGELATAADEVADLYTSVPEDAWARPGRRSNGSAFTVDSIARYHLHDAEHHLADVRRASR
ncbi:MAG TPA: DinB family protein [Nocardioidaceae bacterium]|nr:DinB family protein [Nocardioidaceae bacterium]